MVDPYPLLMRQVNNRYAYDRRQEAALRFDGYNPVDESTTPSSPPLDQSTGDARYVSKSDLVEFVQDILAGTLQAGSNVIKTYDDVAGTLTLTVDVPPSVTDPEVVRDVVGAALVPGLGMTIQVNDAQETIAFGLDIPTLLRDQALNTVQANIQVGTSYTLVGDDAGHVVEMTNDAANVVVVPLNATTAFPVGTVIEVDQIGSGQTTITAAGGVTLRAPSGTKIATQFGAATLRKRSTDEWILSGLVTT